MTETLSAMAGLLGGLVLGATMALMARGPANPYARWLGRTCWVRPCGREVWEEHVITAVSWRGAVCVRRTSEPDHDGYWIRKDNVGWRVRLDRPRSAR